MNKNNSSKPVVNILSRTILGTSTLLFFANACAMGTRESRDLQYAPKAAHRVEKASFDPRNYHAAINRHHAPGDTDLHTSLQALFYGTKRVYAGSEANLDEITEQEWQQTEQHHLQFFLSKDLEYPSPKYHHLILCTEQALNRAHALLDIIEAKETCRQLENQHTNNLLSNQKKEELGQQFCIHNDYLYGKLLDYPEDDLAYFYERNKRLGHMNESQSFEQDKQEAMQFLAARHLLDGLQIFYHPATSFGSVQ